MKKFYSRFRVMLLTFAFGLSSVYFFHNINFNGNELFIDATFVRIAEQPRFTESFRGCGMGYVQGYFSSDGLALTEGNLGCKEPKKNDKRIVIKDDKRIISKIETEDRTYFEIYQLEKSRCIDSPTIELGLELEEFLKNESK